MALHVGPAASFLALLSFGLLMSLGVGSGSAFAGPPKENEDVKKDVARNYVLEGDEALDKGDLTRALDRFERAEKLIPAPTVQLRIGRVQIRLGNLLGAREKLDVAAKTELPPEASPAFYKAVVEAQRELAALLPRIPTLEISGPDLEQVAKGATIDKKIIEPESLTKPFAINPGLHIVELSCCGAQEVDPKEGDHLKVVFKAKPKPEAPKSTEMSPMFIGGLVSLGTGVVFLGLGLYNTFQVLEYRDKFAPYQVRYSPDQDICSIAEGMAPDNPLSGSPLTAAERDDVQGTCKGADNSRIMQVVSYPLAAVGVGVGVSLLLLSRPSSKPASSHLQVLPMLGANQNGLLVHGTF